MGKFIVGFGTVKGLSLLAASQKATEPYGASGQSNYLFFHSGAAPLPLVCLPLFHFLKEMIVDLCICLP